MKRAIGILSMSIALFFVAFFALRPVHAGGIQGLWLGWWHEKSIAACGSKDSSTVTGSFLFDRREKPVQQGSVSQIGSHTAPDGADVRIIHDVNGPSRLQVLDTSCDRLPSDPQYMCPTGKTKEHIFYDKLLTDIAEYIAPYIEQGTNMPLEKIEFKTSGRWLHDSVYANEVYLKNTTTQVFDPIHTREFLDRGLEGCGNSSAGAVGPGPRLEFNTPSVYPLQNAGFLDVTTTTINASGRILTTMMEPQFFTARNVWMSQLPYGFRLLTGATNGWFIRSVDAPPQVNINTNTINLQKGGSATLTWDVLDAADLCTASGDWSGEKNVRGSEVVAPIKNASYYLTCSNARGITKKSVSIKTSVEGSVGLVLSASNAVVKRGEVAKLNWTSHNTSTCIASGGWSGFKNTGGIEAVTPLTQTTYTLRCQATNGDAIERSVTLSIADTIPRIPANEVKPIMFEANLYKTTRNQPVTLRWQSPYVAPCTASGGWSGKKGAKSTEIVYPQSTTIYTLECFDERARISQALALTIVIEDPRNPLPPTPSFSLSVVPPRIQRGTTAILSWSGTRIVSCQASNGWLGPKSFIGGEEVSPFQTTTYVLQCTDDQGKTMPPLQTTLIIDNAPAPVITKKVQPAPAQKQPAKNEDRGRITRDQKGYYSYVHPLETKSYPLGTEKDVFDLIVDFAQEKKNTDLFDSPIAAFNLVLPQERDTDADGLSDSFEQGIGLDPRKPDTDDDGYPDKTEVVSGYSARGPGTQKKAIGITLFGVFLDANQRLWYGNPRDKKLYYIGNATGMKEVLRRVAIPSTPVQPKKK